MVLLSNGRVLLDSEHSCSLLHIFLCFRKLQCYEKVIHGIIIVIGIFGGITSSYSAILKMFSPYSFVPPCYVNYTRAEG